MIHMRYVTFLLLSFLTIILLCVSAQAQIFGDKIVDGKSKLESKNTKSEIEKLLDKNPPVENKKPLSANEMANQYFMKCISESKPLYTTEIQEYLCGCTAAKMSEFLTAREIKSLYEDNKTGEDARAKFIIHGFSPCMRSAITEVSMRSCLKSPLLREIIIGKKKICDCASNAMGDILINQKTSIIINQINQDPMTLDPLHGFLQSDHYKQKSDLYLRNCYNAHNKK